MALIEAGRGAAALTELRQALAKGPAPGLRIPTRGPRYVDYLPHLHLAVAAHLAGDPGAARRHLAAAEAAGVAARSEAGAPLLRAYRLLLGEEERPAAREEPPPAAERPGYLDFERRPEVLSEAEARALRDQVLARCHLDPGTAAAKAPWYFHYELGLELARRGDPQRALDALIEAAERQAEPRRTARMYGMWFIDYLPYFQIARLHAELGNWGCAADALRISREKGEVAPADPEFPELKILEEEVSARAD